ncbi:MAG TPA: hypothetical protein VKI41_14590 [Vicinamibacteria bacterium]|nr:hypothetical protein [Vicinamibacteria bacterium]
MGTGSKIAIGCGIAVLLGGVVVIVGLGAGAYWVKGKAQQYAGDIKAKTDEINKYEKEANRNPFTAPADGVIQEDKLQKFLGVRKDVHAVYQQHKPEFDSLSERTKHKKDMSLSETVEGATMVARLVADIRLVQMKALAAAGMSEAEYRYIQQAVYSSGWASEFQKQSGGKQPADMMAEPLKQTQTTSLDALRKAGEAGVPGASLPSEADLQKAGEAMKQLGASAEGLRVPQANIDLFRKYEADIKQYAMSGLAFAGL